MPVPALVLVDEDLASGAAEDTITFDDLGITPGRGKTDPSYVQYLAQKFVHARTNKLEQENQEKRPRLAGEGAKSDATALSSIEDLEFSSFKASELVVADKLSTSTPQANTVGMGAPGLLEVPVETKKQNRTEMRKVWRPALGYCVPARENISPRQAPSDILGGVS
ncbi:hypothetical protein CYMTET_22684 [Cymbomonas tetramitiformis]|uniref:Uncharacterized protein n=1 Tax=Cymbomonas tetramitiformis TaxID=36881 RepID=A0AAE0L1V6_9CHLO|nr:hypothetical protein CYMTET_22684 [Cymbomonas tetramitiformis]